jgi:hypothetical protein
MKLCELEEVLSLSKAVELNPAAKYLVVLKETVSPDHAMELQGWLAAQGLDVIVFPAECRLFEITA